MLPSLTTMISFAIGSRSVRDQRSRQPFPVRCRQGSLRGEFGDLRADVSIAVSPSISRDVLDPIQRLSGKR
ncbi:MAG: hypothetical protein U0892_21340 [Pirellulales bacterium]